MLIFKSIMRLSLQSNTVSEYGNEYYIDMSYGINSIEIFWLIATDKSLRHFGISILEITNIKFLGKFVNLLSVSQLVPV